MKTSQLAEIFDELKGLALQVNTKIPVQNDQGHGLISYRGYLIEYDDFIIYIGNELGELTTLISWNEFASIDVLDMDKEMAEALMEKQPGSGSKN